MNPVSRRPIRRVVASFIVAALGVGCSSGGGPRRGATTTVASTQPGNQNQPTERPTIRFATITDGTTSPNTNPPEIIKDLWTVIKAAGPALGQYGIDLTLDLRVADLGISAARQDEILNARGGGAATRVLDDIEAHDPSLVKPPGTMTVALVLTDTAVTPRGVKPICVVVVTDGPGVPVLATVGVGEPGCVTGGDELSRLQDLTRHVVEAVLRLVGRGELVGQVETLALERVLQLHASSITGPAPSAPTGPPSSSTTVARASFPAVSPRASGIDTAGLEFSAPFNP